MKHYLVALFVIGNFTLGFSQEASVKLKDLEIPTTPGFAVLDEAPTQIETNTMSKAFVINLISQIAQTKGLPQNYGVIITPFWFIKTDDMTATKFWGLNHAAHSPIRLTSVSLASVGQVDKLNRNVTNVSLGIKMPLLEYRAKSHLEKVNTSRTAFLGEVEKLAIRYPTANVDFLEAKMDSVSEQSDYSSLLQAKPLFSLEIAAAANQVFVNQNYHNNAISRVGVWATAQYAQSLKEDNSAYINASVLGRYLYDQTQFDVNSKRLTTQFLDAGGKLEFEYDKLSVAYEAIFRRDMVAATNDFRHSGILKYRVLDNTYFTGSFGKNFGTTQNLIAFMGVNLGILNSKESVNDTPSQ
ncbi:MAG: hypothetical protein ACKVTZ_08550 [Bacteroidia bacterium]